MSYINELNRELSGLDNIDGVRVPSMRKGAVEKANFAIQVKRLTNALDINLPYVIFGQVFSISGFVDILPLPSGITCVVSSGIAQHAIDDSAKYQTLTLQFSDGVDTDTIEITTKAAAAYPSLLAATSSDVFDISKLRLSISPSTEDSQFDTDLSVVSKTIFGKEDKNPLNIASYKKPDQFQTGIVDIVLDNVGIDKEACFVGEMIPVAGLTVTHSFSVSRINKFNRNLLK